MSQIAAILIWLLCLEFFAWAAWPLAASLFQRLAGRGVFCARPLGLLIAGYLVWLLVSLRLLENTRITILLAIIAVAGLARWVSRRERLADLWRSTRTEWLTVEALFLLAFLGYLAFRAYDPSISHTEKPMDFGFLNAILRSRTFPPKDMWLSGFAISYYYFGYLLMSLPGKLAGVPSGIAYNLALGTVFALTITGAYGLVRSVAAALLPAERRQRALGLLGAFLVAVAGNLEGVLELLHANGIGSPAFWEFVNIPALTEAPQSYGLIPAGNWWWWRATRLIQDYNLMGKMPEVIAEFPSFSFILGDLHPHVMSLPFTLLALAIAWQLLQSASEMGSAAGLGRLLPWLPLPSSAALIPLIIGALGFLNSWDFPTYALVTILAYGLGRAWWHGGLVRRWFQEVLAFSCLVLAGGLVLYLPFYIGLRSQASGLGIVDYAKTPWPQYLLVFGLFLVALVPWLWSLARQEARQARFVQSYGLALAAALFLPMISILVAGGFGGALRAAFSTLWNGPWVALGLAALLALCGALLWGRLHERPAGEAQVAATYALLLAGIGFLLTFGTEFFFVRDSFGTRMNTVFKFYYQAWVLLGVAATIAVGEMWRRLKSSGSFAPALAIGATGLVLLGSLYYPLAAAASKANFFAGPANLDGTAWLDPGSGEGAAIAWLASHADEDTVIVEAPGDDYSATHNRVSAWTGIPTVIGWAGHEGQWRGNNDEVTPRLADVQTLFQSRKAAETQSLLAKYDIDYVYIGPYEREKYGLGPADLRYFDQILDRVYDADGVIIYRTRERQP